MSTANEQGPDEPIFHDDVVEFLRSLSAIEEPEPLARSHFDNLDRKFAGAIALCYGTAIYADVLNARPTLLGGLAIGAGTLAAVGWLGKEFAVKTFRRLSDDLKKPYFD
ncbi:MAG: hypothetical protein ACYCPS_01110 [Candidatus Saccharimonadales bacterium]